MKIPPEIDSLMWQLAESEDVAALDQFGQKYPDYKVEMTRRLKMVRGLKGAKPEKAAKTRDKFMPSPRVKAYGSPRWVMPVVAVGLLASVVFATVGTMRFMDSVNKKQVAETNEPVQMPGDNSGQVQSNPGQGNSTPQQQNNTIDPPKPQVPPTPFDSHVTVVASRIRLADALQDIAAQAGVSLEWAPGMPDIEIAVDYRDVPAKDVLQHMGNIFGFTAVPQSQNSALLIPAVDQRNGQNPMPNVGSSSEAGLPTPGTGVTPILDDYQLNPNGE